MDVETDNKPGSMSYAVSWVYVRWGFVKRCLFGFDVEALDLCGIGLIAFGAGRWWPFLSFPPSGFELLSFLFFFVRFVSRGVSTYLMLVVL